MKKILALTAIVASFGLVACSDDSGSSTVSCLVKSGDANQFCIESSSISESDCTKEPTDDENSVGMGGVVVSACPTGQTKKCTVSGEGGSGTMYTYSASYEMMCDE